MGVLSKIFKGIKKVVRKIGGGIKRLAKKIGGAFGKLGILGHIGLMFLMPYASTLWGNLGQFGTQLAQGTSIAGKAFGHVMRGVYHAGKAVGTVYKTITSAVEGSLKWMGNRMGNLVGKTTDIFTEPFENLQDVFGETDAWVKEGWVGKMPVDTPVTDKLAASLAKPPTMEEMTEGFEYKPETPDYMKDVLGMNDPMNQPFIKQDTLLEQIVGDMDPNLDIMTGETIKAPTDFGKIDFDSILVPDNKQTSFGEKFKSFGTDMIDKTKQQIRDIPETYIQGAVSGVKEAGQRLILGSPEVGSSYQTQLSFGTIGSDQSILDALQPLNETQARGFGYGSQTLDAFTPKFVEEDPIWFPFLEASGVTTTDPLTKMYYNQYKGD